MNNSPFSRAFTHSFTIEESERELPLHDFIFKYMLMHGSLLLQDRYLKKIGEKDSLTFEVTYLFNDKASDEAIIEELKKINIHF